MLLFENEDDRTSFLKYNAPIVEIKDLIDGKRFFDVPIKSKEETYEPVIAMSKNSNYIGL